MRDKLSNDSEPNAESTSTNEKTSNQNSDKKASVATGKKEAPKPNAKPVKVVSKLPHKDVDPMSADKGVDAGRVLIDAAGQDSNGKSMKLSDYKGKVILLDVWASW